MGQKGYCGRPATERSNQSTGLASKSDNKPIQPHQMLFTALFERILKACISVKTGLSPAEVNQKWSSLHSIEKVIFSYPRWVIKREQCYFRETPGGTAYEISGSICDPLDGQITRGTTVVVTPALDHNGQYNFKATWTETFSGWIVTAEEGDVGAEAITMPQPSGVTRQEIQGCIARKKKFPVGTVTWDLKTISDKIWEPAIDMTDAPEASRTITSNGTTDVEDAVFALLSARSSVDRGLEPFPAYHEAYAQGLAREMGIDLFGTYWRHSTPREMRKLREEIPEKLNIPRADQPFPEGWNAHDRLKELEKAIASRKEVEAKVAEMRRLAAGRRLARWNHFPTISYSAVAQTNVAVPVNPLVQSAVYPAPQPAPAETPAAKKTPTKALAATRTAEATPAKATTNKSSAPASLAASEPANPSRSTRSKAQTPKARKVKTAKPGTMAYYSSAAQVQATAPKAVAQAMPNSPKSPKVAPPVSKTTQPTLSVEPAKPVTDAAPAGKLPAKPVFVTAAAPPKQIISYSVVAKVDLPTAPVDPKVMTVVHPQPVVAPAPTPAKAELPTAARAAFPKPGPVKPVNEKPVKTTAPATSGSLKSTPPATAKAVPKVPKVKAPKPGTMAYYSTAAAAQRTMAKTTPKATKVASPAMEVTVPTTAAEPAKKIAKPVPAEPVLVLGTVASTQAPTHSATLQAAPVEAFVPMMSGALQAFVPNKQEAERIEARQAREAKAEEVEIGMVMFTKIQLEKAKEGTNNNGKPPMGEESANAQPAVTIPEKPTEIVRAAAADESKHFNKKKVQKQKKAAEPKKTLTAANTQPQQPALTPVASQASVTPCTGQPAVVREAIITRQKKNEKPPKPKAAKRKDATESEEGVATTATEEAPATSRISEVAAIVQSVNTPPQVSTEPATTTEAMKSKKAHKQKTATQPEVDMTATEIPLEMKKASIFLQVILHIVRGTCSVMINDWLEHTASTAAENQAAKEAKAAEEFAAKKLLVRSRPVHVPEMANGDSAGTAAENGFLADIDWDSEITNLSRPRGQSCASQFSRTSDDDATQALYQEGRGHGYSASFAHSRFQPFLPLKVAAKEQQVEEHSVEEQSTVQVDAKSCRKSPTICTALVLYYGIQAMFQTPALVGDLSDSTVALPTSPAVEPVEELDMPRPRQVSLSSTQSSESGPDSPTTPKFSIKMTVGVGETSENETEETTADITKSAEPGAAKNLDCTFQHFNAVHGLEYGTINFGLTSDSPLETIIDAAKQIKTAEAETKMEQCADIPLTPLKNQQQAKANQTLSADETRMLEKVKRLAAVETFAPGDLFKALRELAAEASMATNTSADGDAQPEETLLSSEALELSPIRTSSMSEPETPIEPAEETITMTPAEKDLMVIQTIMDAEQIIAGNPKGCGWTIIGVQVTPKVVHSTQA